MSLTPEVNTAWGRVIVHADMDAFFAAVEELDEPGLRGRPMVVGGASARSVVATANYAARRFGIGSAMPMARARRRCRDLIIRPPRFERYRAISRLVMAVFRELTPIIEPLSLDEAFLDVTHRAHAFPSPEALGHHLRARVFGSRCPLWPRTWWTPRPRRPSVHPSRL